MNDKTRYCMKHGHDWAFQNYSTFMVKTCLRCRAVQFFFPEEVDYEPDMEMNE